MTTDPQQDILFHYSAALDEIHRLRTALAYEARVIESHLEYKTFPQSRRFVAVHQVARMLASAQGSTAQAYAETSESSLRHVRSEVGIETLTRSEWEAREVSDRVRRCRDLLRGDDPRKGS